MKSILILGNLIGWALYTSGFLLYAQSESIPSWLAVIVQSGSFGLIVYLIVVGIPQLRKEVAADQKAERTDFRNAIKELTNALESESLSVRNSARDEVERLRSVFQQEQRETRLFYAEEAKAMRDMYFASAAAMRTAVHDVREVAQVAVNKASVAVEAAKIVDKRLG